MGPEGAGSRLINLVVPAKGLVFSCQGMKACVIVQSCMQQGGGRMQAGLANDVLVSQQDGCTLGICVQCSRQNFESKGGGRGLVGHSLVGVVA